MKLQKWAHWAEITASIAVVVTLVFLTQEVQRNTRAINRQADLDRANTMTAPFFEAPELASVLAKIKIIDGADPLPHALVERYALTHEEAILWERHLYLLWLGLEADFESNGPSAELEDWVTGLLENEDERMYWETSAWVHDLGFRTYVDGLHSAG